MPTDNDIATTAQCGEDRKVMEVGSHLVGAKMVHN